MRIAVVAACIGLAGASLAWGPGTAFAGGGEGKAGAAGDRLGERIEAAIKADGPFFTAAERAVIERKCGYAPGSFDGYEANIRDGGFVCRGGERVADAEMRALLADAEPRIEARLEKVMESAEVQGAIRAVAREAEREALAAIDQSRIAREAAREAEKAAREASRELERALRKADRDSRR
jgi:hypothetical protein